MPKELGASIGTGGGDFRLIASTSGHLISDSGNERAAAPLIGPLPPSKQKKSRNNDNNNR